MLVSVGTNPVGSEFCQLEISSVVDVRSHAAKFTPDWQAQLNVAAEIPRVKNGLLVVSLYEIFTVIVPPDFGTEPRANTSANDATQQASDEPSLEESHEALAQILEEFGAWLVKKIKASGTRERAALNGAKNKLAELCKEAAP